MALLLLVVTTNLSSMAIVREREQGTLEQLNVTPLSRAELIGGKLLPYAVIGLLDVVLVLLVAVWWFSVPLRGSVWLLVAMTMLFLVAALGLGIVAAAAVFPWIGSTFMPTMDEGTPIITIAVNARAERMLGCRAHSIVTHTYFITDAFDYDLSRFSRLRVVGRLVPYKGHEVLIRMSTAAPDTDPANRAVLRDRVVAGMKAAWDATKQTPLTVDDVVWKVEPVVLPPTMSTKPARPGSSATRRRSPSGVSSATR